jgi:hypothetical protein
VHKLDRINANKPAKLLDSRSLTLRFWFKQIWPVFMLDSLSDVAGSVCARDWRVVVVFFSALIEERVKRVALLAH